mmetsp:Transcript_110895/g.236867  ORF Transcript_110895/g.236867 Transcript_110895/m.236867 type:complete len:196 (+) Transcript_110895:101-688(+)
MERPYTGASEASSRRSGTSSRAAAREMLRGSHSVPQLPIGGQGGAPMPPASMGGHSTGSRAAMPLGNIPYNNVPGYTGFIPGKGSENVLGTTHSRTNALALVACSRRGEMPDEDHFARRTNAYGLVADRRGATIPGYTGYIPAKTATNVFGTTFANSNTVATQVRREQALNRSHVPPTVSSAGPFCWTGLHAAHV